MAEEDEQKAVEIYTNMIVTSEGDSIAFSPNPLLDGQDGKELVCLSPEDWDRIMAQLKTMCICAGMQLKDTARIHDDILAQLLKQRDDISSVDAEHKTDSEKR